MMDILISIRPKWCDLIFSGKKTAEIRRTKPKHINDVRYVYIYQTGHGGVIGRCELNGLTYLQAWIDEDGTKHLGNTLGLSHCLSDEELFDYAAFSGAWAWQLCNVVRFDKPMHLNDFGLKRAPQSWCYVPEMISVKSEEDGACLCPGPTMTGRKTSKMGYQENKRER